MNHFTQKLILVWCFLHALSLKAYALITVTPGELIEKSQWIQQNLMNPAGLPPFSFIYNGQSSSSFLSSWARTETDTVLDANRTQHLITWTQAQIQVECIAVEFKDYPMVEWTVYFKNVGATSTPIIGDIQGLATTFTKSKGKACVLHCIKGDSTTPDSFQPYDVLLGTSANERFSPLEYAGKSSTGPRGWPYYNLQMPGGGVMIAIGWPGQWSSRFFRDVQTNLVVTAGQELTHLYLKPGEEIRTPLTALFFWQGTNVVRAQNLWRHWYLDHVMPRVNRQLPPIILQVQTGGDDTASIDEFLKAGIPINLCWRDAGGNYTWYPSANGPYQGEDAYLNTGTWEVDPAKYPHGFSPFSDWLHEHHLQFLLWFEPERVGDPHSWLATHHPEWLLPGEDHGLGQTLADDAKLHAKNLGHTHGSILNEGDPAALKWLTHHTDQIIKTQGIDWYREDMNGDGPLPAWRRHDEPDRQGMTENLYVQGHLAYWDSLLRLNPGLRIDACASGGRRDDLETMRRAVPFTRSDFQMREMPEVVEGNQCHTYGLSFWLPYQGSGCRFSNPYSYRSFYMAEFGMCEGLNPDNAATQQRAYLECQKVAPFMLYGDYYPLTAYSLKNNVWIGWQFDRPQLGQGCVQAFRRPQCDAATVTLLLSGLKPDGSYELNNLDAPGTFVRMGRDLMGKGLTVRSTQRPGSVIIFYRLISR